MENEEEDTSEIPSVSLHALAGSNGLKTMQLQGKIAQQVVVVLVDLESTHNFLSEKIDNKEKLEIVRDGILEVVIASGETLASPGCYCNVTLTIQGISLIMDFHVLPLEGYDVVLRTQWLRTLGPINWDFSKMLMKFYAKGKEMVLQGCTIPTSQLVNHRQMERLRRKKKVGFFDYHLHVYKIIESVLKHG
ncbi:hypothetical protein Patl1_30743 [Pistacia atlantica]|uniref:Uncharacterized protein n=1 Tax=Pistacia atlantica TaxID=434234 RepID=A0ACC1AB74_9ROSI|nr:hypothetical protein Patl1_30743 [Pistacia atlantica]